MANRPIPPGLLEGPTQRMYLADGTAIGIDGTVRAAAPNVLAISAETNHARMRIDNAPTLTTGVLLRTDNGPHWLFGYNSATSTLRFQRLTGVCVVNVQSFKQAGS